MTEVAAEVADGLLVMPFNSSRHIEERTRPAIERGLAQGGRSEDDFEVIGEVIVAMGSTDEEQAAAIKGVQFLLAFYASTPAYRPVLEVEGWGDLQPRLQEMTRRGEWSAMPAEIDESMVPTLAVAGTPAECADQIVARFGGFADRVCCYFPGYPVTDAAIGELASAIHRVSGESGSL
jgi:probable F420-dependent oxidoreductase